MSEIFLNWRVTLMGKKAQNMSYPHKSISQNMPGQISKEEGESGNYIFFELEDRIRIAMGIIFGPEGGEWQSGSQRANVHSYSAHNETCPSSKIAFDVRCFLGLRNIIYLASLESQLSQGLRYGNPKREGKKAGGVFMSKVTDHQSSSKC